MARDFSSKSGGQSVKDKVSDSIYSRALPANMRQLQVNLDCIINWTDSMKDTGFNVGTNDITVDIKVDPDEFSLEGEVKKQKHEHSRDKTFPKPVKINN